MTPTPAARLEAAPPAEEHLAPSEDPPEQTPNLLSEISLPSDLLNEHSQPGAQTQPENSPGTPDPAISYDFVTQGTPSTEAAAITAANTHYQAFLPTRPALPSVKDLFLHEVWEYGHLPAVSDTRAYEAWAQGWTGKDVKVGHLDDFSTTFAADHYWAGRTHGEMTRYVTQQVAPEMDHAARQITLTCSTSGATQRNELESSYNYFNDNGYHIVNNSFSVSRYKSGVCPGSTSGLHTDETWQSFIESYAGNNIFLKAFQPAVTTGSYDPNMLFIYSAGNQQQNCEGGVAACNLYAATIHHLRTRPDGDPDAGDRVMFIGSLEDGYRNNLASYSHVAGEEMKYDYMVAHDDVTASGGAGTSYAAPRVAGAAALVRHKFPNLDGTMLKQVLLQTAEDLGDEGVDTVFGHGKLHILNALSPVGRVTPR